MYTKMTITWRRQLTEVLAIALQSSECLWNSKCPDYSNKHMRASALKYIQAQLIKSEPNISTDDIRSKIQSLRRQYRKELRLIEASKRNGGGPNSVRKTKMWCFDMLDFFRPVMQLQVVPAPSFDELSQDALSQQSSSSELSQEELSEAIEEKLIEAVRPHRALYDMRDPNYMKKKANNSTWSDIAKQLNMGDGEAAKNNWLKLRASLLNARRMQQKCLKRGVPLTRIKLWKYQKQMSFIKPSMTSRRPKSYNIDDSDNDNESDNVLTPMSPTFEHFEIDEPEIETTRDDGPNSVEEPAKPVANTSIEQPATPVVQHYIEQAINDPLYNFFISMYQLTKGMPRSHQHMVRSKVFNAVSEAEANIINVTSRRSPSFLRNIQDLDSSKIATKFIYSSSPDNSSHCDD